MIDDTVDEYTDDDTVDEYTDDDTVEEHIMWEGFPTDDDEDFKNLYETTCFWVDVYVTFFWCIPVFFFNNFF
jgi:hypothetical protein